MIYSAIILAPGKAETLPSDLRRFGIGHGINELAQANIREHRELSKLTELGRVGSPAHVTAGISV
jgi:hypothetical protein